MSDALDPLGERVRPIYAAFGRTVDECPTDRAVAAEKAKQAEKINVAIQEGRLAGLKLTELNVSGRDLSYRDLSNLGAQKLYGEHVVLRGANLSSASFGGGSLDWANLEGAELTRAHFRVRLGGTNLRSSAVDGANFVGQGVGPDLTGATGSGAGFSGGLAGTNLSGAKLPMAHFIDADLANANFSGTVLTGASFDQVSVVGANFANADLNGTKWMSVTYDCATKFPDQFDPNAAGLVRYEDCVGSGKLDFDHVTLNTCDDNCLRWLSADQSRSLRIKPRDTHGNFIYIVISASFPGKNQCPRDAFYAIQGPRAETDYLKSLKSSGFCPAIRVGGAPAPDHLVGETGWNDFVRYIEQVRFLDYVTLEKVALPAIQSYYRAGGRYRLNALEDSVRNFGEMSTLLDDLVADSFSLKTLADRDITGGGGSEKQLLHGIAVEVIRRPKLFDSLMDRLDRDPQLVDHPGYLALMGAIALKAPSAGGAGAAEHAAQRAASYIALLSCERDPTPSIHFLSHCVRLP
jgi:uncharacterized protein YjbI with pentapeptide repeats